MTFSTAASIAGSANSFFSFILLRMNEMTRLVSGRIFDPNAVNVKEKAACAFSPPDAAVTSATGFPENAVDATVQSRAFFKAPGTPSAYSGMQKKPHLLH